MCVCLTLRTAVPKCVVLKQDSVVFILLKLLPHTLEHNFWSPTATFCGSWDRKWKNIEKIIGISCRHTLMTAVLSSKRSVSLDAERKNVRFYIFLQAVFRTVPPLTERMEEAMTAMMFT